MMIFIRGVLLRIVFWVKAEGHVKGLLLSWYGFIFCIHVTFRHLTSEKLLLEVVYVTDVESSFCSFAIEAKVFLQC